MSCLVPWTSVIVPADGLEGKGEIWGDGEIGRAGGVGRAWEVTEAAGWAWVLGK